METQEIVEAEILPPEPRLDAAERAIVAGAGTQFIPGQSGNPRGRPPKRIHLPSMLQEGLDQPYPGDEAQAKKEGRAVRTKLEVIRDLIIKVSIRELQRAAKDGDPTKTKPGSALPAFKLLETVFGRAPKEVVHSGSVDHTGTVVHEHKAEMLIAEFRGKLERIRELNESAARKALTETTE